MTDTVVTSIDQATPEWLTATLFASGALVGGAVAGFDVDIEERRLSTVAKLKVRYSAEARGERPANLLLKMVNADMGDEMFGASEVSYYARDYVGLDDIPLVRSYDASYSTEADRYHILMDDHSDTHVTAVGRAPTLEYGLALAEGLDRMHAHWWDVERLNRAGEPIHDAEHILRYVDVARDGLDPMLEAFGAELDASWPDALADLFDNHPRKMVERIDDGNGFTLIHGDVNPTNVLVPRDNEAPVYIIDRQPFDWSLTTWLGVSDISYMMVHWWEPTVRASLEVPILEKYHSTLQTNGVTGYPWEQLWSDYLLCAVQSIYVATEWCAGAESRETHRWVWEPQIHRSMAAFFELDCAQLWR